MEYWWTPLIRSASHECRSLISTSTTNRNDKNFYRMQAQERVEQHKGLCAVHLSGGGEIVGEAGAALGLMVHSVRVEELRSSQNSGVVKHLLLVALVSDTVVSHADQDDSCTAACRPPADKERTSPCRDHLRDTPNENDHFDGKRGIVVNAKDTTQGAGAARRRSTAGPSGG